MHLSRLAAVGLILIAFPAMAQQSARPATTQQSVGSNSVLGSYTCAQQVPCADSMEALSVSSDQWAAAGDACMVSAFGYAKPDGFMDPTMGLDRAGCLTSKSGADGQGNGTLTPRCCVIALPSHVCAIHCDLVK